MRTCWGGRSFLLDAGLTRKAMAEFMEDIALVVVPVEVDFRWRPQLSDPVDEMVLEAAINARAAFVTWNLRDFGDATARFGLELLSPGEALRRIGS